MASCSWAVTEPDPGADLKTDSDKMIREKPDDLKKYVVCKDTVDVCEGRVAREGESELCNGLRRPVHLAGFLPPQACDSRGGSRFLHGQPSFAAVVALRAVGARGQ